MIDDIQEIRDLNFTDTENDEVSEESHVEDSRSVYSDDYDSSRSKYKWWMHDETT